MSKSYFAIALSFLVVGCATTKEITREIEFLPVKDAIKKCSGKTACAEVNGSSCVIWLQSDGTSYADLGVAAKACFKS